jgi:hypothetical protein
MHLVSPPPANRLGCPKLASKHFDPDTYLAHAYVPRDEALAPLAERATQLIELRKLFRESVPAGFSDVCEVANVRRTIGKDNSGSNDVHDTVVILAANSAAAAKLKQLCPRLMALFQKQGWQVNAIKITVQGT